MTKRPPSTRVNSLDGASTLVSNASVQDQSTLSVRYLVHVGRTFELMLDRFERCCPPEVTLGGVRLPYLYSHGVRFGYSLPDPSLCGEVLVCDDNGDLLGRSSLGLYRTSFVYTEQRFQDPEHRSPFTYELHIRGAVLAQSECGMASDLFVLRLIAAECIEYRAGGMCPLCANLRVSEAAQGTLDIHDVSLYVARKSNSTEGTYTRVGLYANTPHVVERTSCDLRTGTTWREAKDFCVVDGGNFPTHLIGDDGIPRDGSLTIQDRRLSWTAFQEVSPVGSVSAVQLR